MSRARDGRRFPVLSVKEDVARELRAHLEMRTEELRAAGVPADEAERHARDAFGDLQSISRDCRDITNSPDPKRSFFDMFESLLQDLRFAGRTLAKSPSFVVTAVLTLGLGIGANTAIFSVVNAVLLRPLPYGEPGRIVALWESDENGNANFIAAPNFFDWRERSTSFDSMALIPTHRFSGRTTVLGGELPVRMLVGSVTSEFFQVMGVAPAHGRLFSPAETQEGGSPALIISDRAWRFLLGATPSLDDATLNIYGIEAPVVGVMGPGFDFPKGTDVWFNAEPIGFNSDRTSHNWGAVGRLADGTTVEQARGELNAIGAALKQEHGEETDAVGVAVQPLLEELVGDSRRPLTLLLGASVLVLLVACSNLASSLLARGSARAQEIAIRASLGAGRRRLVRQLLTESVLLTAIGAVAGLIIAQAVVSLTLTLSPESLPRAAEIRLDRPVLLFALGLSAVTAILFGLLPALRLTGADSAQSLHAGARKSAGSGSGRMWSALVVVEVAMALLLLIGSGLLLKSFWSVLNVDRGFQTDGVLTVDLAIPSQNYPENEDVGVFLSQALQELGSIPGVEEVGLINHLPLGGTRINGAIDVEGRAPRAPYADYRVADGGYFAALDIAVLAGRVFTPADTADAEPVVVINERLARELWPNESAVGKHIGNLANDNWVYGDDWMRIIGIVGNVRHRGLTREPSREVYVHYLQRPMRARGSMLTLRSEGEPTALMRAVRARLQALDDEVPIELASLDSFVSTSIADRRFTTILLTTFGGVALLLSALGIYGVVSYAVARRTREMGIRLALGAEPKRVRAMVIAAALRTVALGIGVGVAAAVGLTRVMESLLYEVSATDPLTFVGVVLVLFIAAWLASWLPARRSARIDPMITMRAE